MIWNLIDIHYFSSHTFFKKIPNLAFSIMSIVCKEDSCIIELKGIFGCVVPEEPRSCAYFAFGPISKGRA